MQGKSRDICIGIISSVHGVRGNVKIRIFTENFDDIENFKKIYDEEGNVYKFKVVEEKKDHIIASIDNINSRNEAENLLNLSLYVNRNDFPETSENEYYYADLIGLNVLNEENKTVGKVHAVVNYGAGDIIEITPAHSQNTFMVSFCKDFFPKVDIQKGYLVYSSPEEVIAA